VKTKASLAFPVDKGIEIATQMVIAINKANFGLKHLIIEILSSI
jgi:hypothetical protein